MPIERTSGAVKTSAWIKRFAEALSAQSRNRAAHLQRRRIQNVAKVQTKVTIVNQKRSWPRRRACSYFSGGSVYRVTAGAGAAVSAGAPPARSPPPERAAVSAADAGPGGTSAAARTEPPPASASARATRDMARIITG